MRVLVEVIDKSLSLRGPIVHVGERLWLETEDPKHRAVLDAPGWVRRIEGPALATLPASALTADGGDVAVKALAEPPVDRMLHEPVAAKVAGKAKRRW